MKIPISRDDMYDENGHKFIQNKYFNLNKSKISTCKRFNETDGSIGKEIYFTTTSYALAYG